MVGLMNKIRFSKRIIMNKKKKYLIELNYLFMKSFFLVKMILKYFIIKGIKPIKVKPILLVKFVYKLKLFTRFQFSKVDAVLVIHHLRVT